MKCRHDLDPLVILELSTQPCNSDFGIQKVFHCSVSQYDDYFRLHRRNLTQQEWFADGRFFRRWRPVAWRPATVDVAYEHLLTFQAERFNNPGQQLPGPSDEGTCLCIFICTWCFAHKH